MESFSLESMVRGYHVYKDIWISSVGEQQLEKINKICVSYHYLVLTASLASFIASGVTMSDSGPLGSGRDESGLKYQ